VIDDHESYPPGFFEETYGSLVDDPLPLMPDQERLLSKTLDYLMCNSIG